MFPWLPGLRLAAASPEPMAASALILNGLEDKGIGGDSLRLEQLGEASCRVMRLGNNYAVAVAGVQGQGLAPSEARILAFQAAIDLCPDVIPTASVPPPPIHSGGLPGGG